MNFRFPFATAFAITEELLGIILLCLLGCAVFMILRAALGGHSGRSGHRARHAPIDEERARETEVLERMLNQLDRMERRMQNLETIISDKDTATQDREDRS